MTAVRWLFFLLVSLAALSFILDLEPSEDATSLLPDRSGSQVEMLKEMGLTNKVFISLQYQEDLQTGGKEEWEALKRSTSRVGRFLEKSPLFKKVHYHLDREEIFSLVSRLLPHLPVLLDQADLREVKKRISNPGLRKILLKDFRLLNSPSGLTLKDKIIHDPLDFSDLVLSELDRLKGRMRVNINEGYFTSSGRESTLIWGESSRPLTNSRQASLVHSLIKKAVDQETEAKINYRISGPLRHTLANNRAVKHDLKLLLPLAALALGGFLLWSTGSLRVFPVLAIPFLAAPVAIWSVSLIHNSISLMALGFGIVLLGLSVDFAVHIFLHQSGSREDNLPALKKTLILAWLTSISCFGVLLFSSVPAHRQMALLAVIGISWALVLSWQLIPGISGKTFPKARLSLLPGLTAKLMNRPGLKKFLVSSWILLILGGILAWPHLDYNGDLRTFDVADSRVAADETFFKKRWKTGDKMIFAAASAPELDQALNINDRLYQTLLNNEIKEFRSVAPVLPGPDRQKRNRKNWQDFWDGRLQSFQERLARISGEIGFAPDAFKPFLDNLKEPVSLLTPDSILDQSLSPLFSTLIRSPGESPGNREEWLILSFIPESSKADRILTSLTRELEGLKIISHQSWRLGVENLLRREIRSLSLYAALIIIGLTAVLFRNFRAVIAVLAPMGSALAGMTLFAFFSSGGVNLMHILMAIMVMGLSVDYGIFTVCNHRDHISPFISRAVAICAVSSLIGFGILALARHPALQSLGITVLVGIGLALPTALWISPVLLGKVKKDT